MKKGKVSQVDLYSEWCKIRSNVPSYRLGQHYSNRLGVDLVANVQDLWHIEDPTVVDEKFAIICEIYCWDVFDLPVKFNITEGLEE